MLDVGAIYVSHWDMVFRYLRSRLNGPDAYVEDLTADVFERALRFADSYEDRGFGPVPWLRRIAFSVLQTEYRRLHSRPATTSLDAHSMFAESIVDHRDDLVEAQADSAVNEMLSALAQRDAALARLILDGYGNREAGAALGMAIGHVSSTKYRMMRKLRRSLEVA